MKCMLLSLCLFKAYLTGDKYHRSRIYTSILISSLGEQFQMIAERA